MTFHIDLEPNLGTIRRKANYESGELDQQLKGFDFEVVWGITFENFGGYKKNWVRGANSLTSWF